LFEAAIARVGADYNSEAVWNKYIEYETLQCQSEGNFAKVFAIYAQVLQFPVKLLEEFYNRFKVLAVSRPIEELLFSPEERQSLGLDALESDAVRRKVIMEKREELFQKTLEEKKKKLSFEENILRPYFHVQALPQVELDNWYAYLDFEEAEAKKGEQDSYRYWNVIRLYERALISAANYPELWIRYAKFLEKLSFGGDYASVVEVYERATNIFTKTRPEAFFAYADFLESKGDLVKARELLDKVCMSISPGLLEAIFRRIDLEIRAKQYDDVVKLFEKFAKEAGDSNLPLIVIRHCQYLATLGNLDSARDVFQEHSKRITGSASYFIAFALIELRKLSTDLESRISNAFKHGLEALTDADQRAALWKSYLQIARERFSRIDEIRALEEASSAEVQTGKCKKKRISSTLGFIPLPEDSFDDNFPSKKRKGGSFAENREVVPPMPVIAPVIPPQIPQYPYPVPQAAQQQWYANAPYYPPQGYHQ
jgi:pre-mRNA-processing factor 39